MKGACEIASVSWDDWQNQIFYPTDVTDPNAVSHVEITTGKNTRYFNNALTRVRGDQLLRGEALVHVGRGCFVRDRLACTQGRLSAADL